MGVHRTGVKIVIFLLYNLVGSVRGFTQERSQFVSMHPDITIIPEDESANFGTTVACGDVDDDGFDDIIIGVPVYNASFEPVTGYVYVIYGNENLINTIELERYLERWTRIVGESEKDIGSSLAVGDLNGDGIGDLMIGANSARSAGLYERGAVYVLYGIRDGWTMERRFSQNSPDIRILGENEGDHLGNSVTLGDVNGDGLTDILMGAPSMERAGAVSTIPGGVFIVLQPPDAFDSLIDLNAYQGNTIKVFGRETNDRCGWNIAGGDVDQDGIDDILIGAYKANPHIRDEGEAYFIAGSMDIPYVIDLANSETMGLFQGDEFAEHMGYCVALGDLNGDGWEDYILGSRQASNTTLPLAGKVRIVFGGSDSIGVMDFRQEPPDVDISGGVANGQFGAAICMGNLNGDGIEDLIVGASVPLEIEGTQSGLVYIFNGRSDWPDVIDLLADTASITLTGMRRGDWFGYAVACGDINGDGADDVVIGAPKADSTGRVYVVFGYNETAVHDRREESLPAEWILRQNYPNPFNQNTMIPIEVVPERTETTVPMKRATIQILTLTGEIVQQWDISNFTPGDHFLSWTGKNRSGQSLPSGIYLCRLERSSFYRTRKMILLR